MKIESNFSLKKYNTFGIEAKAKQFVAVTTISELKSVLEQHQNEPKFILGGGSNMLLTQDINALVIHVDLKGNQLLKKTTILYGLKVKPAKFGTNWFCGPSIKILVDWKTCRSFRVM